MQVKLTKIKSTHNNLRTEEVIGWSQDLPKAGFRFALLAKPLYSGDVRIVKTSEIQSVTSTDSKTFQFETENSTYELEILDEVAETIL